MVDEAEVAGPESPATAPLCRASLISASRRSKNASQTCSRKFSSGDRRGLGSLNGRW